jgi:hypothetical protein
LAVELYPNTLPTLVFREYFSDEVWIQSNTGNSSSNADVRNVTVTSNVAFGNVTVNVTNHVIRFSGSYTVGFIDNVVYTQLSTNTQNSYYWLEPSANMDLYSPNLNSNLIVYQVNSDTRSSININYTLNIQYSSGGSNDVVTITRPLTQNINAAFSYLRTIYP